jgi:hypothetical protein
VAGRRMTLLAFTRKGAEQVEAMAEARHIPRAMLIREALGTHARTLEPSAIARRNAGIERVQDRWRIFGVRVGPVMTEVIRARAKVLQTSLSALSEACCLQYLDTFRR